MNNNVMESKLLMSLILEDFDMDDDIERVNRLLLSEDDSAIKLFIDDEDSKEEFNINLLVDKISDDIELNDNGEEVSLKLNNNDIDDFTVKVNKKKNDSSKFKLETSTDDNITKDIEDKEDDTILSLGLKQTDQTNNTLSFDNVVDSTIDTEIENSNKLSDEGDSDINLKLNDSGDTSLSGENDVTLTIKKNLDPDKDKDAIQVKLTNTTDPSNNKEDQFIKKRDELIESNDPNYQLSSCLKIIIQLKKSLEKLISYIPNETTLVQTKYLLGNMLDNILDNSDSILKDQERLKEIIYKVFDMVLSINKYIIQKYYTIENKLQDSTKESEDEQIQTQIKNVEKIKAEDEKIDSVNSNDSNTSNNTNNTTSDNNNNNQTDSFNMIKRPNINRTKI